MKVCGKRSSRKPTSLENLFRTRPAVETVVKALDHRQTDRQIARQTTDTDRQTDSIDR